MRREICPPMITSGSISTIYKSEKGESTNPYLQKWHTSRSHTFNDPNKTLKGLQLGKWQQSTIPWCVSKVEGKTYLVKSIITSTAHSVLEIHLATMNNRCSKRFLFFDVNLTALARALYLDTSDLSFLSELIIIHYWVLKRVC